MWDCSTIAYNVMVTGKHHILEGFETLLVHLFCDKSFCSSLSTRQVMFQQHCSACLRACCLDSRSKGLGFNSHYWSHAEMLGKVLTPYYLCLTSSLDKSFQTDKYFSVGGFPPASNNDIVLFKMFSRWFFANNKTNITSTALQLCSPTEDVMS